MGKQTFRVTGKKGFRVTGKWASEFRVPGAPEWARHLGAPWGPFWSLGPQYGREGALLAPYTASTALFGIPHD